MADTEHLAILKEGVETWNRWRASTNYGDADLSGADLSGMKLNEIEFLRTKLRGAILTRTQLERAHLKEADLTGATLDRTNLKHVNAREAIFDEVVANHPNFEVSTLRGARFRRARFAGTRFHRAYLRDADLTDADFSGCWLRFARLDGACCQNTNFSGADMRHASLVKTDLRGANLTEVHVFGISAWSIETDANTRQDLIVGKREEEQEAPLRAHDLHTAQLLGLMLDGDGVRAVLNSVTTKLVLILGSFAPEEKAVLDALRQCLQGHGYVGVEFDFERPTDHDYSNTVMTLAGMSRFVVADFTNAKEVRSEVKNIREEYRHLPVLPIAREDAPVPDTMLNLFTADELGQMKKYRDIDDLIRSVQASIIELAEERLRRAKEELARAEAILRSWKK